MSYFLVITVCANKLKTNLRFCHVITIFMEFVKTRRRHQSRVTKLSFVFIAALSSSANSHGNICFHMESTLK